MSPEGLYRASPIWLQNLLLNAYAWRVERHRYGRPYARVLHWLLESERWPVEELRAYQNRRVETVVRAAYDCSPYYRTLLDERGLSPGDIRSVDDLQRVPLLEKSTVRENAAAMLARTRRRRGWLHGHTSGTTGSPLSLWYDRETCVWTNAVDGRQKRWAGMESGDWIALFLGRMIAPQEQEKPPFWRTNRIQRQVWFSAFHMNEENLPAYVDEIRRRNIKYLEGYPSTIYILARHVLDSGHTLPMKGVFTSSETLHVQRGVIEEAFRCRIRDFYGLAERVIFAAECEAGEKHLAEEYGYTEVVDATGRPVGEGQLGYLVGTSLHNLAMPMIRYRTGDISAIESGICSCGRSLRRIRSVTTKAEDIVITPEGAWISPSILTHPFKPFHQILKSQIIQESLDRVDVKIVPSDEFTEAHAAELRARLQERLGPSVMIRLEKVGDIPPEPSGKYRWVISNVDHSLRLSWESTDTGVSTPPSTPDGDA